MARNKGTDARLEDALKDDGTGSAKTASAASEEIEEVSIDDDEPEDVAAAGGDEPRGGRDEKKRERGRAFAADLQRERQEKEELRAQNERLLQLAERVSARGPAERQGDDLENDSEIKALKAKQAELKERRQLLGERFEYRRKTMTREEEEKMVAEAERIDEEIFDARAGIRDRIRELKTPKSNVPEEVGYIRSKYHHVVRNTDALRYAQGEYLRLIAKGRPASGETFEQSLREAEREFRLGSTDVSESQRSKFTSASGGGGGGGGGPRTIKMTPERKKMADAAYSHIKNEAERYTKWAKVHGPKILEREKR
jgi:hypothetical protein